MRVVTSDEMRRIDHSAINDFNIPGILLMERSGLAVANAVMKIAALRRHRHIEALLFAGKGNNGGDAFAAASFLTGWGVDCKVIVAAEEGSISGDAKAHLELMKKSGVFPHFADKPFLESLNCLSLSSGAIVVDAVLGTGITGAAKGLAESAIRCINQLRESAPVISVDVPSGINADTGSPEGEAVKADVTFTLGMPKTGFLNPDAVNYTGSIEIADIGLPVELVAKKSEKIGVIAKQDLKHFFQRRKKQAHKGTYGHLLVIGGSSGFAGAPAMAAMAALRSGTGLVSILTAGYIAPAVAAMVPEAMVHSDGISNSPQLLSDSIKKADLALDKYDAVLIGPGLGLHPDSAEILSHVLTHFKKTVVVDADALRFIPKLSTTTTNKNASLILTPHPGEMAGIMQMQTTAVQEDRLGTASEAAKKFNAVVALKGCSTVVASQNRPPIINLTGNPGMASGGTGDVLAGIVAGLCAQGFDAFDAMQAAVYLHGKAGDVAAWQKTQISMTATDVIAALPHVFKSLCPC